MFGSGKRVSFMLGAAVALTLGGAVPAQAAMSCWNDTEVAAARVRDLQSRLMVDALRCRAFGIDILGAYNEFVRSNRSRRRLTLPGAWPTMWRAPAYAGVLPRSGSARPSTSGTRCHCRSSP